MTQVEPIPNESVRSESEELREQPLSPTPIDRILQKLSCMELPAKEHFECYMRHKWRLNHKPRTLASSFTSVMLFLDFYGKSGKSAIERMERVDLEGFIEQEQDRGLRISTVRTRLACIIAFLHFLMEQDIIPGSLLKRGIKLKLPDVLPRAMNPADVRKLLCVMDDIRDRALFLLLLRTGMRIGEALGLRLNDLDIKGRKVHLYEGEKNSMGRVVYLSDDALFAIKLWLRRRDKSKEFVFYGQGHGHLCYSTGRGPFREIPQEGRARSEGLHGSLSSPYICLRASQRGDAPGMSPAASGSSGYRGDPPIRPAHRHNPRARVLPGHGRDRKRRDRWNLLS